MDGWAVTKEISARMHDPDGRMLKFETGETAVVGEVVTSPTSSENIVDAEPGPPASDLTEEQRALAAFAAMDADGDGELSADEIYRALSKNSEVSLERVKELVAKADTDETV